MLEFDVGTYGSLVHEVDEESCIRRGGYDIYSTPQLISLVEYAAMEALAPYLDESETSVGVDVDITHSAPALLGQKVSATAKVRSVERRKVEFTVEVCDDFGTLASGRHVRSVVSIKKLDEKLSEKQRIVSGVAG